MQHSRFSSAIESTTVTSVKSIQMECLIIVLIWIFPYLLTILRLSVYLVERTLSEKYTCMSPIFVTGQFKASRQVFCAVMQQC